MTVDEYIDNIDDTHLREIVITFSDDINEGIKWNVPTYAIKKNVCSIMAHKKYINFQIFQGAHINDSRELGGTGKDMRHLTLKDVGDIDETKLKRYLKQAIELDR